tara:strand:+ start:107 stop:289 length:183 start_codon:yes stop_codon:yes gene_type:complete
MSNIKPQPDSIELDLRKSPFLRKVVESLVLTNVDIAPADNALAVAQGVGPHAPIVNPDLD